MGNWGGVPSGWGGVPGGRERVPPHPRVGEARPWGEVAAGRPSDVGHARSEKVVQAETSPTSWGSSAMAGSGHREAVRRRPRALGGGGPGGSGATVGIAGVIKATVGRFRFSVTWFLMYTQISSFGASVAFVFFFSSAGFCHVLEAMTCLHKYVNWSIISLSTSCFIFRDNNNYHMACVLLMCRVSM
jgi:hypothetical protein